MNAKTPRNRKTRTQSARKTAQARMKVSRPVTLHRRNRSEFSCGVDFDRAILVEESLDERERRG